jgi:hypothetical protein
MNNLDKHIMKKLLFTLFTLGVGVLLSRSASQDFVNGVDFTSRTNITQSILNQAVNSASPATNKGLVIFTNGAPNVANDPKLRRYIWLDTSFNPPVLKVYDTNTATWASNTVSAGSIGTLQLADAAVSTVKIANLAVDNSKLADDSVTSPKIVDGTIVAADLGANSVTAVKIAPGVVGATQLGTNVINNSHLQGGIIQPTNLASGFVFGSTNLAADSIRGSNIVAGTIVESNILAGTISSTSISNNSIDLTKFSTNSTYLLPRCWMTVDSGGTILTQIRQPNVSANTLTKGGTGRYKINFATAMTSTNSYVLSVNGFNSTAATCIATIFSNTVNDVWIALDNDAGAAIDKPFMVTIHGF